jgi:hypothetical protein
LPAGITVRLFRGEGEIGPVAALLVEAGLPAATVEQRMKRGDLVALALTDDEELVAYAWTTFTDGGFRKFVPAAAGIEHGPA